MPYDKRIEMSLDKALEETRDISEKLKANEGLQDDAVQAMVEHISKIDNEDGMDEVKVVSDK